MSLLDCIRPKWKHSDPAVRVQAVRQLSNQGILETLAGSDPNEAVRLAAIEVMTAQDVLARFAGGPEPLATAAMKRLTDPASIVQVAFSAESRTVREMAVDRIYDGVTLERIATSDTERSVRLKARMKGLGGDKTREFIRRELAKLPPTQPAFGQAAEFSGTLDDICGALIGDGRFRINGRLTPSEPATATIRDLNSAPPGGAAVEPEVSEACAQFLAFKREGSDGPEHGGRLQSFFEIKVWRTDRDIFQFWMEERSLKVVQDPKLWGRISSGTPLPVPSPNESIARE
jgi:hypothetical protein